MAKKFAIFGNPVEHSMSPKMHNCAFIELGFGAVYYKILLEDGSKLRDRFLEENLTGANITVPHKEAAYDACDELDEFAKRVGAVNTIVKVGDRLIGYNTDAPGFLKSLDNFKDIKTILILGAGGTVQSTSEILRDSGYDITILNRGQSRLDFFKEKGFKTFTYDLFNEDKFDLIVNMTSAGLSDNNYPAPKDILDNILPNAKAVVDIIYGKKTPFLLLAKEYNLQIIDGKEMLLQQGILAFEYFTNNRYKFKDIETIMRDALD